MDIESLLGFLKGKTSLKEEKQINLKLNETLIKNSFEQKLFEILKTEIFGCQKNCK